MDSLVATFVKNPVKRHIIGLLMKHKYLKYSELMPEDTDNVLFNYHLQHLVKSGLVNKEDGLYCFTPEGWVATSHLSYEGIYYQKFVCRFKIYLIDQGKVLLHERSVGPWKGDVSGIWGKVVYGENSTISAVKQFKDLTGLDSELKNIGTLRTIIMNDDKETLDDSIYFIFIADDYTGNLRDLDSDGNKLKWYSLEEAIKYEQHNRGSGGSSVEILKRFKDKNFDSFIFEEILTDNSL